MLHIIEDLWFLRNFKFTSGTASEIYELNINKKNLHCYDIESILKFENLEKINILTDEEAFAEEFVKHVHLFENLYVFSVKLQNGNKYDYVELIKDNCYDTGKILYIKNLKKCSIEHTEDNQKECWDCYTVERLRETNSYICVIQNIEDNYLLNCISNNIEKLTLIIKNLVNFELTNLPCSIQNVTIVYTSCYKPSDFYDNYKDKIKLPLDCKLKIIKYFENYSINPVDQNFRHLHITE